MSATQRLLLRAIEWYQGAAEGRPSPCRFFPTCSSYAHEAIHVHGSARGAVLAVRRLLRCRPLGPSGFDPVPPARGAAVDRNPASTASSRGRAEKGC